MITISDGFAPLLVAALRDAHERCSELIERHQVGDVTDLEEYLMHLGLLEGEVRSQYMALQKQNPNMIPYEKLWPEVMREPPHPPELKRIK